MALESFFEDLVLDTREAIENFIVFLEEEPHIEIDDAPDIKDADQETICGLIEFIESRYGSSERH